MCVLGCVIVLWGGSCDVYVSMLVFLQMCDGVGVAVVVCVNVCVC